MGFLFSKNESPLCESLLENDPQQTTITRTGDLILVPSSDLYVTLNDDPWQHVGVIIIFERKRHVFIDGQFMDFDIFLDEYGSDEGFYVRQLDCPRPIFFDKQVFKWARKVSVLVTELNMETEFYEGFAAGALLAKMNCCLAEEVHRGRLRPYHFSSETAFKRLQICHYSKNIFFN